VHQPQRLANMSIPQGMKPADASAIRPAPQQLHESDGEQMCAKEVAPWGSRCDDFEQAQRGFYHLACASLTVDV
jgi:hypothetical protein